MAEQAEKIETSMTEDLENAINLLEGEDEEENVTPEAVAEETPEEEVPAETAAEGEQPDAEVVEAPPETPPEPRIKPPIDWGPALKQEWNKLPLDVQQAIHSREQSVNYLMQETANDRRTAEAFNSVVNQFRGLMAAEGVQDPMQGITGLLTTTAQLAMGAPQQKAAKIAELIKHYGVDIETLDSILAGQQPAHSDEARLEAMLNQRMQPVNELLNQINQQRQESVQQVQHQAFESIAEFGENPANEFFEDVRYVMADFLDMAAQRGQQMSLKEAYDRACALDPEIQQILAQRPTQAEVIAQKEAAASSVSGRRTAGTTDENTGDLSIRESLERSFGDAERRI